MQAKFHFESDNRLIVYTFDGRLTPDGIMDVLHAAVADPHWSADYDMMCLFDGADFSNFTVEEARKLSQAIRALDQPRDDAPHIRAALVSSDELHDALLTFWQGLGQQERQARDRLFTTEAEARAWLAEGR